MGAEQIVTLVTSILRGVAQVTNITQEALQKGLEQMLQDAKDGKLLPEELLASVKEDAEKLDKKYMIPNMKMLSGIAKATKGELEIPGVVFDYKEIPIR